MRDGDICVSAGELERLIAAHDGDVALLWLYGRLHGDGSLEDAARALCRTRRELEAAREKLRRLEALPARQDAPVLRPAPADELPEYTAKDLSRRSRDDPRFAAIVTEAQRTLGRMLSTSDLKKLFGIYDYLALPPEVIMMLLNYCVTQCAGGNPPTMRYIEKEAYVWANREILTLEQAENYIADSRRRRERLSQAAKLLGLQGRPLSSTETRYLTEWLELGFSDEMLELAYDRTVTKTGGLKWGYMNSILKSWHEKGLQTPADVRDRDIRRPVGRTGSPPDMGRLLAELDKL